MLGLKAEARHFNSCRSNDTFGENLERKLVGATRTCLPLVKRVRSGLPIYMFNISDKKLYGTFEAVRTRRGAHFVGRRRFRAELSPLSQTCDGALDIEPEAWSSVGKRANGSPFPAQVSNPTRWPDGASDALRADNKAIMRSHSLRRC